MASNPEDVEREWYQSMIDQDINSIILDDNNDNRDDDLFSLSTRIDQLGLTSQDPDRPFVFYKVNELCQLSPSNKLPKLKQVKTCGIYKMEKRRMYLVEPLECEEEEFKLDVDFELIGDLPPVGKMIEVFGFVTVEEATNKILFNTYFWRERTCSYNSIAELYLTHRTVYEFQLNKSLLKT